MEFFDEIIEILERERDLKTRTTVKKEVLEEFYQNRAVSKIVETPKNQQIPVTQKSYPSDNFDANFSEKLSANLQFPREINIHSYEELAREVNSCQGCELCKHRRNIVASSGNLNSKLMFIGEVPSLDDDSNGQIFSGDIGELLDKMIKAMTFETRNDIYLTNVVKCRPPANRVLNNNEVQSCIQFVKKEIEFVAPEAIVVFGAGPVKHLIGKVDTISNLRGKFLSYNNIPVMPTFNVGYLLRKESAKREVWQDLQQVMKILGLK